MGQPRLLAQVGAQREPGQPREYGVSSPWCQESWHDTEWQMTHVIGYSTFVSPRESFSFLFIMDSTKGSCDCPVATRYYEEALQTTPVPPQTGHVIQQVGISHVRINSQRPLCCATVALADRLGKPQKWAELNYKIIAFDFARHYCISRENSANTCPNLKTDTQQVGIPI